MCQNLPSTSCSFPATPPLNLTGWFSKPKPNPLPPRKKPSGKRLKVLHLSDFHIDPRASRIFIIFSIPSLCLVGYGTPYVTSASLVRPNLCSSVLPMGIYLHHRTYQVVPYQAADMRPEPSVFSLSNPIPVALVYDLRIGSMACRLRDRLRGLLRLGHVLPRERYQSKQSESDHSSCTAIWCFSLVRQDLASGKWRNASLISTHPDRAMVQRHPVLTRCCGTRSHSCASWYK